MKLVTEPMNIIKKYTRDVNGRTFYNIVNGGLGWSETLSCTEEVYNGIEVGDEVRLEGIYGRKNNKTYLFFNGFHLGK